MLTNGKITIYHKGFDTKSRVETWISKSYDAWFHGGKGASINKGYDNANDVNIRIPYDVNDDLDINNISIRRYYCSRENRKRNKNATRFI